jgi:hypothetical protein
MENTTQITVADLDALHRIVDIAAQRGAFRGAELAQVGAVYDKLTTFLNFVVEQAQANAGTTTDGGETDSSTDGGIAATGDVENVEAPTQGE